MASVPRWGTVCLCSCRVLVDPRRALRGGAPFFLEICPQIYSFATFLSHKVKMMNSKVLAMAMVLLSFSVPCAAEEGNQYRDSEYHFSFAIPEGWEKLSSDEIAKIAKKMDLYRALRGVSEVPSYSVKDRPNFVMFTDGIVLLAVDCYERPSFATDYQEALIRESEETRLASSDFRNNLSHSLLGARPGSFIVDPCTNMCFIRVVDVDSTTIAAIIFAKYSAVILGFTVGTHDDQPVALDEFQRIVNSFKFDQGYGMDAGSLFPEPRPERPAQSEQPTGLSIEMAGKRYRNSEDHFSFNIPRGWEEVSRDVLEEYCKQIVTYTGFPADPETYGILFHKRGTAVFAWPYVCVKISDSGRLPERKIKQYADSSRIRQDIPANMEPFITEAEIGTTRSYDQERHLLRITGAFKGIDGTSGKVVSAIFFGCKGDVSLVLSTTADRFHRDLPFFNEVIDSFRFDPGYEYDAAPHQPVGRTLWVILGAAVGGTFLLAILGCAVNSITFLAGLYWLVRMSAIFLTLLLALFLADTVIELLDRWVGWLYYLLFLPVTIVLSPTLLFFPWFEASVSGLGVSHTFLFIWTTWWAGLALCTLIKFLARNVQAYWVMEQARSHRIRAVHNDGSKMTYSDPGRTGFKSQGTVHEADIAVQGTSLPIGRSDQPKQGNAVEREAKEDIDNRPIVKVCRRCKSVIKEGEDECQLCDETGAFTGLERTLENPAREKQSEETWELVWTQLRELLARRKAEGEIARTLQELEARDEQLREQMDPFLYRNTPLDHENKGPLTAEERGTLDELIALKNELLPEMLAAAIEQQLREGLGDEELKQKMNRWQDWLYKNTFIAISKARGYC